MRSSINRRAFLRISALAAGGAVVAACGGGAQPTVIGDEAAPATPPPGGPTAPSGPQPTVPIDVGASTPVRSVGAYKESPLLKAMTDAGTMPPVAERLPKQPYVVPHAWITPGKYGGTMRWSTNSEWGLGHFVQESMYGHSPIRWLKDGLEIGPGLAESWGPNGSQSEWTFKFREGLKWSDGKPWTTRDIMYWWDDMVLNDAHPSSPPDEARSGKGNIMKMTAPDDTTIVMTFDAPAPLTPDLVACWVKRGIGPGDWMQPRHYLEQFHPKYNQQLKNKKDWAVTHDEKKDFAMNPECPTMTGWMLTLFKAGQSSVWKRNPYYWCVDKAGNQLPYIDQLDMSFVQDAEIEKLGYTQGKVDYVHGGFTPLTLADVQTIKDSQPKSKLKVLLWDSGSGTGSVFFFNQDFKDADVREVIRMPKFRQALSIAFNREEVWKTVYFQSAEITTGTFSPKSIEYRFNTEATQRYAEWRDSWSKYDPERAKTMLDEIGVVDKDGDGWRETPSGGKLVVTLDFAAPGEPEHVSKNTNLARDWKAVGVNTKLNPIPPTGYDPQWQTGQGMSKTDWEVSDGPNHMVNPAWLVPIEVSRWAPLQGSYYSVRGTPKEREQLDKDPYDRTPPRMAPEKGGSVERLWKVYDQAKVATDPMTRHKLVWDMIKIHVQDGPFFMGVVSNYPRIVLAHEGLRNVPTRDQLALNGFVNTWIHPTPAAYDPEAYFWDDPEAHS
ncbi:MAG: ABC transporter substrate-binding protein [Chloroflexia bacterium]